MLIGYLIEKALKKPWLCPIPRDLQKSLRWDAMRLALVGAERSTNIAVVPDGHCIDPTAGNAWRKESVTVEWFGAIIIAEHNGERRRSGRKKLTQDLENLPAGAALTFNLRDPDYVALLCGSLDQLAAAFAALDADERARQLMGQSTNPAPALFATPSAIATASLPKEDRPFIRAKGMGRRLQAAADSRAPRTGRQRPSPTEANQSLTP